MRLLATLATLFVALEHIGFMIIEMAFWHHPIGQNAFNLSPEITSQTTAIAANQGLYNGFLAAGLLWAIVAGKRDVRLFFLICIVIAGVFGALTVKPSIVLMQAVPAAIALVLTLLSRSR